MSFDLSILTDGANKRIQMLDQLNETLIEIHCKGGLMNRWVVNNEAQPLELVLGNTGADGFELNGFRSGKMGPFSCRIDGGKYQLEDQTYEFKKFYLGPHALHGLIYDAEFSILSTEVQTNYAQVVLAFAYAGTDPGYPFAFDIQLEWTLHKNNLIGIKTSVVNKSNHTIPYMDGWHPYFTLGGHVDNYVLEFHSNAKLPMRDDMIPTGEMIQENNFEKGLNIGQAHYDDCYLLDPIQNKIQISYEGKSIIVSPLHNYPYLQLYTPDDRKSIAIENLSGAPNCFNNKMGLQKLEPQAQIYFETTYQFKTTSLL
jgi:aldose 1-epimerase